MRMTTIERLRAMEGIPSIIKDFATEVQPIAETANRYRFTITTNSPDRERDVIAPDGWQLDAYMKNPVVLWAHDYRMPPVALARTMERTESGLVSEAEFIDIPEHPFARMVAALVKIGALRATSVGFRPLKHAYNEERRGVDFQQQELLEFSIVPVPANADCLIEARAAGIDVEPLREWAAKTLESLGPGVHPEAPSFVSATFDFGGMHRTYSFPSSNATLVARLTPEPVPVAQPTSAASRVAKQEHDPADCDERDCPMAGKDGADAEDCPRADCPMQKSLRKGMSPPSPSGYGMAEESVAWSAPALADFTDSQWGDLDDAEKRRIARHFAWVATMPPESFGDMKLPHHRASDGDVVWGGVRAAMGALMGGRGGVNLPEEDRSKVYRHLKSHYAEWDKDAPEMRAYTPEEIVAMFESVSVPPVKTAPAQQPDIQPVHGDPVIARLHLGDVIEIADVIDIDLEDIATDDEDLSEADVVAALRAVLPALVDQSVRRAVRTARGALE